MQNAVAFFAIRLIAGIAAHCLYFSHDSRKVVAPYFRIQSLLLLGLGVLFGLTTTGPKWGAIALGSASFVGSALWTLERRSAGRWAFAAIVAISLLETWWSAGSATAGTRVSRGLMLFSSLASAATLGAAMCGMLLGHRYLTAPGMPLAPLKQSNEVLGMASILRLAASSIAIGIGWESLHGQFAYIVWLALRWLAGIAGPLCAWFMVRRILVYKNTQSATGVLFVAVILTFIGELTGDVLFRVLGMPF